MENRRRNGERERKERVEERVKAIEESAEGERSDEERSVRPQ